MPARGRVFYVSFINFEYSTIHDLNNSIQIFYTILLKQCVHGTLHIGEKMTMIKNHESHVQSVLEIVRGAGR